jgi:hypothetical protein
MIAASLEEASLGRASSKHWHSSTSTAQVTNGDPTVIVAQATGSNIQAAICTTIPPETRTRT